MKHPATSGFAARAGDAIARPRGVSLEPRLDVYQIALSRVFACFPALVHGTRHRRGFVDLGPRALDRTEKNSKLLFVTETKPAS